MKLKKEFCGETWIPFVLYFIPDIMNGLMVAAICFLKRSPLIWSNYGGTANSYSAL